MQSLFIGTRYDPKYVSAVCQDIANTTQHYPALSPQRVESGAYPYVQLTGRIPIALQGMPAEVPVNVILPDAFPRCTPIVQLCAPPGFVFAPIGVQPNGVLALQSVHTWVFGQSTLPMLVAALARFLSTYPPTTYQGLQYLNDAYAQSRGGSDGYGALQRAYSAEIAGANAAAAELFGARAERAMLSCAADTAARRAGEAAGAAYEVPAEMAAAAAAETAEKASQQTVQELHTLLKNGQITPQQFLDMTRRMSRTHFNDYVFQRLVN